MYFFLPLVQTWFYKTLPKQVRKKFVLQQHSFPVQKTSFTLPSLLHILNLIADSPVLCTVWSFVFQYLCYHNPRETCSLKSLHWSSLLPRRFDTTSFWSTTPDFQRGCPHSSIWNGTCSTQQQCHGQSLAPALPLTLTPALTCPPALLPAVAVLSLCPGCAALHWALHASLVHTALTVHCTPVLPCLPYISPGPLSVESASFTEICQMACCYLRLMS